MIVTVTPNPALDLTYHVDAFVPGDSLRVDAPASRAGGKGVNVARVIRQTGGDALAVVTTGGGTGRSLERDLDAAGLRYVAVAVAGETRRTVAIVDEASGETTIMNERGEPLRPPERVALLWAAERALAGSKCLVVSGSLPPKTPVTFCAELVRSAHGCGVPVIVDATGEALLFAARAGVDVVKPNLAELTATTGDTDPVRGARRLLATGARLVLVSLGADGMLAVTQNERLHARLTEPLDGNPTGAGDAGVAAVARCIADGVDDLRTMLTRAVAWSAAAVLSPVAGEVADDYADFESRVAVTPA